MTARLLWVEDDLMMQQIVGFAFEGRQDVELVMCSSGSQALERVATWTPDMALLDVMMPDMNGPQVMTQLRRVPGLSQLPVVFVTASEQRHEVANLLALGAVGVITKPFDMAELPTQVSALMTAVPSRQSALVPEDGTIQRQTRLNALAISYVPRVIERIQMMQATMQASTAELLSSEELAALQHQAHKLAGSAAIFGYADVSDAARRILRILGERRAGQSQQVSRTVLRPELEALLLQGQQLHKKRPHP